MNDCLHSTVEKHLSYNEHKNNHTDKTIDTWILHMDMIDCSICIQTVQTELK